MLILINVSHWTTSMAEWLRRARRSYRKPVVRSKAARVDQMSGWLSAMQIVIRIAGDSHSGKHMFGARRVLGIEGMAAAPLSSGAAHVLSYTTDGGEIKPRNALTLAFLAN